MPKAVSSPLLAHLAQPVTTMTTCWLLVRTDGVAFGFTTLDANLTIAGQPYLSTSGFSRTAIVNHASGAIDNLEVLGYFSDDGIIERDIRNGKFDYASVYLFAVNWMNLGMGICRLRRGFLGECIRSPTGAFSAELRGLSQALVQEFGNVYTPLCRADLGDHKCGIPIIPDVWRANALISPNFLVRPLAPVTPPVGNEVVVAFRNITGGWALGGPTEPLWNYTLGSTTIDGAITWLADIGFRNIGEVAVLVDQHSFRSTHLVYPGNQTSTTGSIVFVNNITAHTVIEISDGINTYTHTVPFDTLAGTVRANILSDFSTGVANLNMSASGDGDPSGIHFVNHSGRQASITKAGDLVPGMRIGQFALNYLDGGTITWLDGFNAGLSMELKTYDTDNTRVILWLGMKYPITVGDRFTYYPGCDKRRDTCQIKFNNILNFRGEPDMPGMNRMLAYPDAA